MIDRIDPIEPDRITASGLEDVVAATTRLSDVDGAAGRLVIAGVPVEDLAGRVTFEEAVHLLWHGRLPTAPERAELTLRLGIAREAAYERLERFGDALSLRDGMDALRAATSHLDIAPTKPFEGTLEILGAVAVIAASFSRLRSASSSPPLAPNRHASHASDYLRLVTGTAPPSAHVAALDAYFVTVIDHGMNASTFAARVVASTASDTVSAIVAGLGALKGKLHGGAPGPVLDMLDAIGNDAPRAWLERALARGERIMGMGHRIYRVRDPRAFVLERALASLESSSHEISSRLRVARAVEHEAEALLAARHPDRPLRANVEFYTAVLLEAVGIPRALFTPTFAASRAAGWCAHVEEQRRVGRLIRPRSHFVHAAPAT